MDKCRCIMSMLLQVSCFGLYSMTDLLYVKKGSAITLECPYHSVAIPVQWRGPTNLTVISDGNNIIDTLQHFNRLAITGQHKTGEYNLQIIDFNAADQGLYLCNSTVNGVAVQKDFQVHLLTKPTILVNGTTFEVKSEISKFVNISIRVESFGIPVASWLQNTGGRLGFWKIHACQDNKTFCLLSHITPRSHKEFGKYSVRIRNLGGSTDLNIRLLYKASARVRIQGRRNVKVSEGTNLNLTCIIDSTTKQNNFTWMFDENTEIITSDRFNNSEFTIQISRIHRTNTGYYKCQVENEFGFGEDKVKVNVTYKPTILLNGTIFEAKTEISKPVNISFRVESFEIPLVFWHQKAGGKLNTWKIHNCKDSKTFCLLSDIVPLTHKNFGKYSVRIRNTEGSTDLHIRILYKDFHVQIKEERMVLKTSETIILNCSINPKEYGDWIVTWNHVWNGVLIRSFPSVVQNKTSTLELPHCDYKDTGEYVCTLITRDAEFYDTVFVSVLGPPIVTNKSVSSIQNHIIFSVKLYVYPPKPKVIWMHESENKTTIMNLKALNAVQIVSNTTVTIESYGKNVSVLGIMVKLVLLVASMNLDNGYLVCQVQNSFAPAEESFELMHITHMFTKETNRSGQGIEGVTKRQLIYISGGGCLFVALITCVLIYFLRRRKLNRRNVFKIDPISNSVEMINAAESFPNNELENISDHSYEDVGSVNSLSVQMMDPTVIRGEQNYEPYKAETPTELKVYETLNSKNDKTHDNCDEASSSPCSEDSDSYIIPIMDYLELEGDEMQGHTVKDICRARYFDDFDGGIISKSKGDSSREIKRKTF